MRNPVNLARILGFLKNFFAEMRIAKRGGKVKQYSLPELWQNHKFSHKLHQKRNPRPYTFLHRICLCRGRLHQP